MIHGEQIFGNTGCLFARGNCIPFYRISSQKWILLDSGSRHVRAELDDYFRKNGISICGVLCSHAHYDHTENNRYFQETYGAQVVMSAGDAGTVYDPVSLKACFYTHTGRDNERCNHEMLCRADKVFMPWQQQVQVGDVVFQILPLFGHAASHAGFVTPDGVAYMADSVFSPDLSGEEHLTYMLNWSQSFETMKAVGTYSYERYILAHYGVYDDIRSLARENIQRFCRLFHGFSLLFTTELSLDELLKKAAVRYHFSSANFEKAYLFERMIRSMVEYLLEQGRICRKVQDGVVVYYDSLQAERRNL